MGGDNASAGSAFPFQGVGLGSAGPSTRPCSPSGSTPTPWSPSATACCSASVLERDAQPPVSMVLVSVGSEYFMTEEQLVVEG